MNTIEPEFFIDHPPRHGRPECPIVPEGEIGWLFLVGLVLLVFLAKKGTRARNAKINYNDLWRY